MSAVSNQMKSESYELWVHLFLLSALEKENSGFASDNISMYLFGGCGQKTDSCQSMRNIMIFTSWCYEVILMKYLTECFRERLRQSYAHHRNVNTQGDMHRAIPRKGPTHSIAFSSVTENQVYLVYWLCDYKYRIKLYHLQVDLLSKPLGVCECWCVCVWWADYNFTLFLMNFLLTYLTSKPFNKRESAHPSILPLFV